MPTRDRCEFALQAIRYFQRQDYAPLELMVVDDGDDALDERLPADPRIRYMRAPPGESIGAKRNRACDAARGELIVALGRRRLVRARARPAPDRRLAAGAADITAFKAGVFFDLERWAFWRMHAGAAPAPVRRRRARRHARLPGSRCGRRSASRRRRSPRTPGSCGARCAAERGFPGSTTTGLFIYLRHGGNVWRFSCGDYLDADGWRRVDEPPLPRATERSTPTGRRPLPIGACR